MQDPGILIHKAVETAEKGVGRPKEVELVVAPFSLRERREEVPSAPCGKECSELHDIAVSEVSAVNR